MAMMILVALAGLMGAAGIALAAAGAHAAPGHKAYLTVVEAEIDRACVKTHCFI
jgi:hypothetical protein